MQAESSNNLLLRTQQKVGILGGAFNPVHLGHLLIAQMALSQGDLDQIVWVPTYQPPHKTGTLAAFVHRLAMVQQAIAPYPQFTALDIDQQRGGVSYAIATLNDLESQYPQNSWHWVIGLDAFQSLPHWRDSAELARRCQWLVAPRSIQDAHQSALAIAQQVADTFAQRSLAPRWQLLDLSPLEISASQIRRTIQEGRSPSHLPNSVRDYIHTHALYQNNACV